MGDSSRSLASKCGACEYVTTVGVQVSHYPLVKPQVILGITYEEFTPVRA